MHPWSSSYIYQQLKKIYLLYMYDDMFCLSAKGHKKWAMDYLELELQILVSYYVGARNQF